MLIVSIAIGEVLPILWNHLFEAAGGTEGQIILASCTIIITQLLPAFVKPSVRLHISGRLGGYSGLGQPPPSRRMGRLGLGNSPIILANCTIMITQVLPAFLKPSLRLHISGRLGGYSGSGQ